MLANDVDCVYRGPLLDGKSHGKGSVIWEDGTVYEGDFEHGYRTGEGKLTASDGVIFYVGGFLRGALTNGKRTYPDGGVFEGRFHLGGRSKGIYTYPDGKVFKGEYTWLVRCATQRIKSFHEGLVNIQQRGRFARFRRRHHGLGP